jgi:diacylglycerol kinase (ATP)
MKIKVISNPKSRGGRGRNLERILNEKFGDSLVGIERTICPKHATQIARLAAKERIDAVVTIGGDGTVNEVANGIVGTKTALGIIPTGTANDLASYYHIPTGIAEACDVIMDHHVEHADVIRVNQRHYVTAGGIGLAAEVAAIANAVKRNGTTGWLLGQILGSKLYILAVLCALLRRKGPNLLSVRWNDGSVKADALSVTVNNQPFLGRRFLISPGAINGDGLADICFIENTRTLFPTVLIILRVLAGKHIHSSSVKTWRANQFMVETEKPVMFLGDGEIVTQGTRFNIEIVPKAMRVLTPAQEENE